ncbi:MAG: universal stress protein [Haloglomus sp.]
MSDETNANTAGDAGEGERSGGGESAADDSGGRKHVLVPLDGSEQSDAALQYVLDELEGARVTLLHVINPAQAGYGAQAGIPTSAEEWLEEAEAEAEELFAAAREQAEGYDIDIETATEVGNPARIIVESTEERDDIDHVVMGSHGRSGLSRVLLGSVAETVVRRSTVPVTVVR